jgi:hypothetical protein
MKKQKITIVKKLDGHVYGIYGVIQINWYDGDNTELASILVDFAGNRMLMFPLETAEGVNIKTFENPIGNLIGHIVEE